MDIAYRVPDNDCECETPDNKFKKTRPITEMNVKSIIGYPTNNALIYHNSHVTVRGVAFDEGVGIRAVVISTDNGKTWKEAQLDDGKAGRYAFREFRFTFKPTKYGKQRIMARAINRAGKQQPLAQDIKWNHGGYKYNGVDEVIVEVV
jgi:sulfoxide reductase catalytic subunit YedY